MELETGRQAIPVPGGAMPLYVARPAGDARLPAIVVIHEIGGLVPHTEDVARRFAAEGFVAAAPNLFFHTEIPSFTDRASFMRFRQSIDDQEMVHLVAAVVDSLTARPDALPDRIGIVGYCFGGYTALLATAELDGIAALADYYGGGNPETILAAARRVKVPVLGMSGAEDQGIPVDLVHRLEATLREHGVETEFHIYPGAGHAFFNDTSPERYNEAAATAAWPATVAFFQRTLTG